jgi:hypothetical protein
MSARSERTHPASAVGRSPHKTGDGDVLRVSGDECRPGILIHGAGAGRDKAYTEPSEWRNGLIARAAVAHFIVGRDDQPA